MSNITTSGIETATTSGTDMEIKQNSWKKLAARAALLGGICLAGYGFVHMELAAPAAESFGNDAGLFLLGGGLALAGAVGEAEQRKAAQPDPASIELTRQRH